MRPFFLREDAIAHSRTLTAAAYPAAVSRIHTF